MVNPRPLFPLENHDLARIMDEMRRNGVSWVGVAIRLNQGRMRRHGVEAYWLPAGARRWYFRNHPRPFHPYAPAPGPPRSRKACVGFEDGCPFGACRAHMAELHIRADSHDTRPESETMTAVEDGDFSTIRTCVLDIVAGRRWMTNSQLAKELGVSREQARRMVNSAIDSAAAVDAEVGRQLRKFYRYSSKIKGES